jgi:K+-sensing histidine kinase KdpD
MSPLTPVYLQIKRLERRMTASPETVTAEWLRPRLTALCAQFDAFVRGLDDSRSLALALSGNCHLSPERVSLSATVRRVADRLKRESEAAKVPLCITLPNISMDGWWDPNRLESICLFSMSGAIRFAAERRLDVSVDGDDETASLTISGNASPTLWEEDQEVLMRKVAHRESIAGALGNGCWAARHLVRAMRGNLEIRPGASGTLAFVVNLPRHDI